MLHSGDECSERDEWQSKQRMLAPVQRHCRKSWCIIVHNFLQVRVVLVFARLSRTLINIHQAYHQSRCAVSKPTLDPETLDPGVAFIQKHRPGPWANAAVSCRLHPYPGLLVWRSFSRSGFRRLTEFGKEARVSVMNWQAEPALLQRLEVGCPGASNAADQFRLMISFEGAIPTQRPAPYCGGEMMCAPRQCCFYWGTSNATHDDGTWETILGEVVPLPAALG
ncbi:uncharacterized protein BCR38DRAFT_435919 [Pseudomassariella vexata]|uniref:Uncharacterized protein n=1 Tax=Pseudomassariella vexata TaxID=1141098 RepID=A0A1Y2DV37_9PEZI|nr:uncharacterized protein BCR38DRAFT_435919 [Pseudomassariella vexata]ORY63118.1 hypothetical protein BCR38DRAFT_435919 [Pseudomassariella vexata]